MSIDELLWGEAAHIAPKPGRSKAAAAALLRAIGASLDRLALRLLHVQPQAARAEPVIEFCAEAGAPEGALYVNGELVARLTGVTRL